MTKTEEGTVVGLIAGFYDVELTSGQRVRTRARGVFRQKKQKPAVGDHVEVQVDEKGTSYLVKILSRINRIGRPAVAYYQKIGYPVFYEAQDVEKIIQTIKKGEIWTLAGQSGAGKSTLLNKLKKDANQLTGAISMSLNRGKHTTRQVQLFSLGEGFLADTPGFSSIDLTPIKLNELCNYFVEFKKASVKCKFRGCQHLKEPGCEVKLLLKEGKIKQSRYDDYLAIRTEISEGRIPEYLK